MAVIVLEASEQAVNTMKELKRQMRTNDSGAVMRRALALLNVVNDAVNGCGCKVMIVDRSGNQRELILD